MNSFFKKTYWRWTWRSSDSITKSQSQTQSEMEWGMSRWTKHIIEWRSRQDKKKAGRLHKRWLNNIKEKVGTKLQKTRLNLNVKERFMSRSGL